jgi:hypothetical protein
MLFGLEPDVELTGGPWYAEDDFDADFVDALRKLGKREGRDGPCLLIYKSEH